jgi:hypothetical protein
MNKVTALKVVLTLVCLTHLGLGIVAFTGLPEPVTRTASAFYGVTISMTPQLQHVVRILGAFMIAIGVLSGFALFNPQQNRAIIDGVIVLLLLRVLQRVIFARDIHEAFALPYGRLWMQAAFFTALALALLFLGPRKTA